ncbi:MAG: hypothetical protein OEM91_06265 [Hyphomicrobiales bacterium]|nr:hypothetical protein [Hyphomicrobiales bacterium]
MKFLDVIVPFSIDKKLLDDGLEHHQNKDDPDLIADIVHVRLLSIPTAILLARKRDKTGTFASLADMFGHTRVEQCIQAILAAARSATAARYSTIAPGD